MARPTAILDSSVVIDILLGITDATQWISQFRPVNLAITSVTIMEVLKGAHNKQEFDLIGRALSRYQHLHILKADSEWAVRQFRVFWLSHKIGINDCLIGSIAARLQLPIYTVNFKDFDPFPDVSAIKPY